MRLLIPVVALASLAVIAHAADKEKFESLPEPPPPVKNYKAPPQATKKVAANETLPEPEVHITTQGDDRHEEYRLGGKLYMIKVVPKKGRPYYLIDKEGRGEFVRSDLQQKLSPPMWVIKSF